MDEQTAWQFCRLLIVSAIKTFRPGHPNEAEGAQA